MMADKPYPSAMAWLADKSARISQFAGRLHLIVAISAPLAWFGANLDEGTFLTREPRQPEKISQIFDTGAVLDPKNALCLNFLCLKENHCAFLR
jgi:hypothetical protein